MNTTATVQEEVSEFAGYSTFKRIIYDILFIDVSYKNSTELDPHLLQLPGCDALCPLDSFVELTKPIIPDDLTTECAEEVVAGQEYHFEIPAAGFTKLTTQSSRSYRKEEQRNFEDYLHILKISQPTILVCTLSPITSRTIKSLGRDETFHTLNHTGGNSAAQSWNIHVLVVAFLLSTGLVRSLPVDTGDDLGTIIFSSVVKYFTLSTVLVVALMLSTGLVRSLPVDTALLLSTGLVRSLSVDTGDDLGTIILLQCGKYFTLSTVLEVALLLSIGSVRSLPVDTGDDLRTIIFSSGLFRHGDRAPTGTYPNDPYNDEAKYWPRGYGQLTEIGEEQHFKQGSFFRKRYNHILPETYNVNDTYVRTSYIDRTLASAQSNLAGLYPPTEQNRAQPNIKFQDIPIHMVDKSNDQELYSLTIPEWTKPYYPQPLRNLELFEQFITAAGTEELKRLSTAHDSNVVDLLQGLDVFNGILVPYASAVLIELRSKSDEYFITVSYKNSTELDPHLLQLPGCDALCPLDSFVELTKPIIPDDLTTECAEEVVAGQEYHFEIPAAAILPEWEHCFQQPTVKDGRFHRISFTTKNQK
uniref:2-phosphoxylose phosphatase 1 n=1 Tax=Timema poppense TaxID=170557 RepID=A0A7R9D4L1_TIMPO|nr:unnamed protein product [Timema poppensis]